MFPPIVARPQEGHSVYSCTLAPPAPLPQKAKSLPKQPLEDVPSVNAPTSSRGSEFFRYLWASSSQSSQQILWASLLAELPVVSQKLPRVLCAHFRINLKIISRDIETEIRWGMRWLIVRYDDTYHISIKENVSTTNRSVIRHPFSTLTWSIRSINTSKCKSSRVGFFVFVFHDDMNHDTGAFPVKVVQLFSILSDGV